MNEIYLLEQCPRGKQELQKLVNRMRFRGLMNEMFRINLSQSIIPEQKNKSMFWTLEAERYGVI